MAKLSININSKVWRPANFCRTISQAVSRPTMAVSGAAIRAISSVVQNEFQATPVQTIWPLFQWKPKARA
ncbi:hypothetical protein D3C80_1308770 [compost metagenome]